MAAVFLRATLALFILVLTLAGCGRLFFYPQEAYVRTPEALNLEYEDVWFESSDHLKLHGWFLPARGPAAATVLFLHGNAENMSTHIRSVDWLPAEGFNVFLFDYRGYGTSRGSPSIDGIHQDAAYAIAYLVKQRGIAPNRLIVFGQSLGAAVAIHTAATGTYRQYINALVVEGAFSGYRQITREKLADIWVTWPLQWLPFLTLRDDFSPLNVMADVEPIPLLIIHGALDPIIPVEHASRLFEAAREPKQLWIVPQGRHIDAFTHAVYRMRLIQFLTATLR